MVRSLPSSTAYVLIQSSLLCVSESNWIPRSMLLVPIILNKGFRFWIPGCISHLGKCCSPGFMSLFYFSSWVFPVSACLLPLLFLLQFLKNSFYWLESENKLQISSKRSLHFCFFFSLLLGGNFPGEDGERLSLPHSNNFFLQKQNVFKII